MNNSVLLKSEYDEYGFFVLRDFFNATEVLSLRRVILTFHERWKADNAQFYNEEAFNSSLITGSQYLSEIDRVKLFNFISSEKMLGVIKTVIPNNPVFMNTQLFFNPVNPQQQDFWHRDCQYDHDVESQKRIIQETQIVHFRVPLFDELGLELIPGTHNRWDTDEEFNVREELNGCNSYDSLTNGKKVRLSAGDLLVFSADMIHRGLYGLDRLALDILVFDSAADYVDYIDDDCLPDSSMLKDIDDPSIYVNAMQLKTMA